MKQNYYPKVNKIGRVRVCLETLTSLNLKNKYIVDVGSSIGWLEEELLKYKPGKLVGIEPDAGAVVYSQKRVKETWSNKTLATKVTFYKASAINLPIKDSVADIVVMFDVLEHVPPGKELIALKEAYRVLKVGGKFVLSTPNSSLLTNILDPAWYLGHRHYRKEHLERFLKKAGFRLDLFEVRGGLWFSLNLIWHYFMKWVLKKPLIVNKFLERKDDEQFSEKGGIHTIFIVATKV